MESLIGAKLEQRSAHRDRLSCWLNYRRKEAVKQAEHILCVTCHIGILLRQEGFQGFEQASANQLHHNLLRILARKSKDPQEI